MAHPSGYQAIHSLPRGSKHSRRWWWHETAPTPAAHIPLLVYVRRTANTYKMDYFFNIFLKVNFENTMGASTSIQEYSEEVLLAATKGDVAKLMAVLESGDKIVEETEEATKGRFAFSIPFCHYYFEKLRMHLRGSHDWCTVYMRWC